MSTLLEYLKLIPKGINNFENIFQGIKNQVKIELGNIPNEHLEVIAARRVICNSCPYLSTNAVNLGIYKTDRLDEHCMHCGCNKNLKTASLDSDCGIEAYNNSVKNEEDKLTLKWTKFKPNEQQ